MQVDGSWARVRGRKGRVCVGGGAGWGRESTGLQCARPGCKSPPPQGETEFIKTTRPLMRRRGAPRLGGGERDGKKPRKEKFCSATASKTSNEKRLGAGGASVFDPSKRALARRLFRFLSSSPRRSCDVVNMMLQLFGHSVKGHLLIYCYLLLDRCCVGERRC